MSAASSSSTPSRSPTSSSAYTGGSTRAASAKATLDVSVAERIEAVRVRPPPDALANAARAAAGDTSQRGSGGGTAAAAALAAAAAAAAAASSWASSSLLGGSLGSSALGAVSGTSSRGATRSSSSQRVKSVCERAIRVACWTAGSVVSSSRCKHATGWRARKAGEPRHRLARSSTGGGVSATCTARSSESIRRRGKRARVVGTWMSMWMAAAACVAGAKGAERRP